MLNVSFTHFHNKSFVKLLEQLTQTTGIWFKYPLLPITSLAQIQRPEHALKVFVFPANTYASIAISRSDVTLWLCEATTNRKTEHYP